MNTQEQKKSRNRHPSPRVVEHTCAALIRAGFPVSNCILSISGDGQIVLTPIAEGIQDAGDPWQSWNGGAANGR